MSRTAPLSSNRKAVADAGEKGGNLFATKFGTAACLALLVFLIPPAAFAADPGPAPAASDSPIATPALVREIQFMLLSIGIDPGPIDGNARALTNRAAHQFEARSGLQEADIVNNQPLPPGFIDQLRRETARALLKGTQPESAAVTPSPAPDTTAAPSPSTAKPAEPAPPPVAKAEPAPPPAPAPPLRDPFAACPYTPADFDIGSHQYTPQKFLDEGFGGDTGLAVKNLTQRLDEARQIANRIGGPALREVQRQAHVLAYFECRQKIEQATATR
jgi:hypothetical protein